MPVKLAVAAATPPIGSGLLSPQTGTTMRWIYAIWDLDLPAQIGNCVGIRRQGC